MGQAAKKPVLCLSTWNCILNGVGGQGGSMKAWNRRVSCVTAVSESDQERPEEQMMQEVGGLMM